MKNYWFKAKRYGWGWTPATWQGWLIIIAFVVLEVWIFLRIDSTSHSNSDTIRPFIIQFIMALIALTLICFVTGEKQHKS